jgi:hypothetical protein
MVLLQISIIIINITVTIILVVWASHSKARLYGSPNEQRYSGIYIIMYNIQSYALYYNIQRYAL